MSEWKFNIELAKKLRGRDVVVAEEGSSTRGPIGRFEVKTDKDGTPRINILTEWIFIRFDDFSLPKILIDSEGMPNFNKNGHPLSAFGIPVEEFEHSLPPDLETEFEIPFFQPGCGTTARVLAVGTI